MSRMRNERSAGIYLGGEDDPISERTMQRWRLTGEGPGYVKMGKMIRYSEDQLDAYKAARLRSSTSAAA
jgi:Helix-turn-helix domain